MKIIALDSSGLVASVAVLEDQTLIGEYNIQYKKTHSQTLLPMLDELKEMVERLAGYAKGKTRRRVLELANDLIHVTRFEVDESRFESEEYEFVPFMFGENLNAERVPYPEAFQGESVMAISPFIDEPTIKDLTAVQRMRGHSAIPPQGRG